MSAGERRKRTWAIVVAMLGLAIGVVVGAVLAADPARDSDTDRAVTHQQRTGPFRGNSLPDAIVGKPAPAFDLRDARGGRLSTRELRGKPYVLTLLFTNCQDVCPLIGEEIRRTMELLGRDAKRATAVAVSVDPKADTRAAVQRWLRRHRAPPNFHYVIGSRAELEPVWRGYYAAPQPHGTTESRHTASVWVVDARGRWRTKYSGGVPFKPEDLAHDLRLLIAET